MVKMTLKDTHSIPTPTASDHIKRKSTSTEKLNFVTNKTVSLDRWVEKFPDQETTDKVRETMFPTPQHGDYKSPNPSILKSKARHKAKGQDKQIMLRDHVKIFPTPRVSDTEGGIVKNVELKDGSFSRMNKDGVRWGVKLKDAVNHLEMFLTPTGSDHKGWSPNHKRANNPTNRLDFRVEPEKGIGGQLNPNWVEWLMGFPVGWTDLKDSEMP